MLPKINLPQYPITIPSTGKKTTYRPFDVSEEKLLLMASESNDRTEMDLAISKLIENCVKDVPNDLKSFDVEYIFAQLRSVSVGNTVELKYRVKDCPLRAEEEDPTCESEFLVNIDLQQAKVQVNTNGEWVNVSGEDFTKKIQLPDDIGFVLSYPSYSEIKQASLLTETTEIIDALCVSAISSVWHGETVFTKTDFSKEDVVEFFNGLLPKTKKEIREYIDNIPVLRYETTYKCNKCDFSTPIELRGIEDFFA